MNTPDGALPRPAVLGSQTATFGTSGTIEWTVAENGRLWQTQPITASFATRMISGIDVSTCQATNVHAFETSDVAKLFRHGLLRPLYPAWRQMASGNCFEPYAI
jgi:hypothetical protein